MRRWTAVALLLFLAGCAAPPQGRMVPVLLLGEQHDAASHQQLHRDVILSLADRDRLAAVVLEMAEQGRSTHGLPAGADDATVQQALRWSPSWPWAAYGPVVMAAVRAGVPVHGGNLPRDRVREVMRDTTLEGLVPPPALAAQERNIRAGHCNLLPESQILPMTRVQIARDRAMADTLQRAVVPGKTVVLVAGVAHVDPAVGVPLHLPRDLRAHPVMLPGEKSGKDYCEDLRRHLAPKAPQS